jgi:polar amino acid transport system substrate-binding protein
MPTRIAGLLLMLALAVAQAAPPEMTFLAPSNHMMPVASFQGGQMNGGFLKEISEVLAGRMGYTARFHTVPSKRVSIALTEGEADGVCYVLPLWLVGKHHWTRPAIPGADAIVAHVSAPVVKSLHQLVNERVGTVLGYRYTALGPLENVLLRDDAPSVEHTLAKLVVGRSRYAIVDQMTIAYYLKTNPAAPLRVDLVYANYKASCAFSLTSHVNVAEVERVLAGMVEDGTIEAILARYR